MTNTHKEIEHFTIQAQQVFGPGAKVTGSAGMAAAAGTVEIRIDGEPIGTGETFADALRDAAANVSARLAWWASRSGEAQEIMLSSIEEATPAKCWQVFGAGKPGQMTGAA